LFPIISTVSHFEIAFPSPLFSNFIKRKEGFVSGIIPIAVRVKDTNFLNFNLPVLRLAWITTPLFIYLKIYFLFDVESEFLARMLRFSMMKCAGTGGFSTSLSAL